ncbi:MAG: hypothetical protein HY791_24245 [Deltaproteobacteria bacterium]|nr:hypothetical protein [Deltaproteobacteria bacterium]
MAPIDERAGLRLDGRPLVAASRRSARPAWPARRSNSPPTPNGDRLSYDLVSLPDHGVLTKPDGTPVVGTSAGMTNVGVVLRYQPVANYNGPDQLVFLRGQTEASLPAAVSLTITPVSDAPRFTSTPRWRSPRTPSWSTTPKPSTSRAAR